MPNPKPSLENLVRQKPRWQHLPTVAVRIPECFVDRVMPILQSWDRGEDTEDTISDQSGFDLQQLQNCTIEQLLELQERIPPILKSKRESTFDRRLESAILFLAGRCDGAAARDGAGFNGADASYGHWLADRIDSLTRYHAENALKLLHKYHHTQLEPNGFDLPTWDAIAHQYPEKNATPSEPGDAKPEKRIEIVGAEVGVYAPYDATGKFQATAKSIKGYRFEGSDKSWRYPISKVAEIVTTFPVAEYEIDAEIEGAIALVEAQQAEAEAQKQAAAEQSATEILKLIEAAEVDAPLLNGNTLFEHQKEGAKWLLAHRRDGIYQGGVLADQMGLGKTLTTLVAAKAMHKLYNCPVFVICPATLRANWAIEAEKVGLAIETYSWAKLPAPLEHQKYLLIGDECHYIQSLDSQRTKGFIALSNSPNCHAAWCLTGTPLKNGRPANLFPLLVATGHPLGQDRRTYERKYCNGFFRDVGRGRTVWDTSGAAHLDELSHNTTDVILRRKKAECLDLPEKIRSFKPVELESSVQRDYDQQIKALVQSYRDRAKAGEVDPDAEALVTLSIFRKIGSQFKVNAAIALVQEILEQGESVVIFTEFLESAKAIHAKITSDLFSGELLTGDTPTDARQGIVDRFQSGESKVFIGTIKAGGVGLTLTKASNVILVDRAWTPGDCEQAEDRCHRIGAKSTVTAFWMQLGQIDLAIDTLLQSKQDRIELVLKGKRKTLRGVQSAKDLAKELLAIL